MQTPNIDAIAAHGTRFNEFYTVSPVCMPNRATLVRDQLLVEYEDGMTRFGFEKLALVRSLLTADYRLTLYKNEVFGELYDLRADPLEQHNRFDDDEYAGVRAEIIERLAQEMMMNMETSPRALRRA